MSNGSAVAPLSSNSSSAVPASTSTSSSNTPLPLYSRQPSSPAPSSRRRAPPAFHFLAGLCTGSLSAILLQPADLLKTRLQQSRGSSLSTTLHGIQTQPGGFIRSLWRGTLPSVIRTGFGSALYFAGLNGLRGALARNTAVIGDGSILGANSTIGAPGNPTKTSPSSSSLPKLSNAANLATGALARGGAGLVMMPITVLKVRYESSMYGSYSSMYSAARGILAAEGVRGLYAGYGATLVRDAPYAGLYVLFYEQAKGVLGRWMPVAVTGQEAGRGVQGRDGLRAARVNFAAGCLAAATATAVTNPFDAIKTRIQLMPGKYRNMANAAKMMLREDGMRSLFDGMGLRMARKAMSSALAWTIYEDLVRRAELHYAEKIA